MSSSFGDSLTFANRLSIFMQEANKDPSLVHFLISVTGEEL